MNLTLPTRPLSVTELRALIIKNDKEQVQIRAEELRVRMDPGAIMSEMIALYQEADGADEERLEQLKFKSGILSLMLKKCMPDLRSLEVTEKSQNFSKLIIDLQRDSSSS